MASWWERDPAALAEEMKELTDAGFRVRREVGPGARLALVAEKNGESFRLIYHHTTTREGTRLVAFRPATDPEVGSGSAESALATIERMRTRGGLRPIERGPSAVFVPTELRTDVSGAGGTLRLGRSRMSGGSYALRSLTGSRNALLATNELFLRAFPDPVEGLWARGDRLLELTVGTEAAVRTVEDTVARAHGLAIDDVRVKRRGQILGIVRSLGVGGRAEWLFVRRGDQGEPIVLAAQEWATPYQQARAPFADRLAGKSVTLIGCGAVGWTAALELARSGVSRFVLYDDDAVRPYNLARLQTYLGASGRFKVDALAEQLQSIAPGIQVEARPFEVGTHVGTAGLVAERSDLLINVTGEEVSTDETNAASIILGRPAIYGWISNGVVAGRIFRVRPGASACYDCVREAAPAPIRTAGAVPTDPEHAWVGAGFNVDNFACALARLAVLTLAGEPVSERNPDHFVLDFDGVVPIARVLRFQRRTACRWCA